MNVEIGTDFPEKEYIHGISAAECISLQEEDTVQ